MRLHELSDDQKAELRQRLVDDRLRETEGRSASYGELMDAESTVSDEELDKAFGGTEFVPEDFLQ